MVLARYLFLLISFFCNSTVLSQSFIPFPNDSAYPYPFAIPTNTYHNYCKNVYSQNGEDGILEQLIKELGIVSGTFCEFGASDGITSSNTYNLIKNHNFSGIAIEFDRARYEQCVANYSAFPLVRVFHGAVLHNDPAHNLDAWLKKGNLPADLDLLSIDIDYDDYYVWEGLNEFNPKIVVFETNSYRDPVCEELPGKPCTVYTSDPLKQWKPHRVAEGCSFMAAVKLGLRKGYIPVAYTGNITFVRKDLVNKLHIFPYLTSDDPYDYLMLYTPLVLWDNKWMTNSGLILNTAIRDYYLTHKRQYVDIDWLNLRTAQIIKNVDCSF